MPISIVHRRSAGRDGGVHTHLLSNSIPLYLRPSSFEMTRDLQTEHFPRNMPNLRAFPSSCCVFSDTLTSLFHPLALFCSSDVHSIRRRNIMLTFVWHSLSCFAHLSGWETVEMFVRVNHIRAPLQPCLRRGGSGCIRSRPNNRPARRDRMHPTHHGSGRFASHSNLATASRRLRLCPDAQRRGDCLGRPAPQPRLPAPLPAQRCRSCQVSPPALRSVHLARRKPALRLRALGASSLLSIRRWPRRRLPSNGSPIRGRQCSQRSRGVPLQGRRRVSCWPTKPASGTSSSAQAISSTFSSTHPSGP
jgi:hypothetical protein